MKSFMICLDVLTQYMSALQTNGQNGHRMYCTWKHYVTI